jgi:hypothetical protein
MESMNGDSLAQRYQFEVALQIQSLEPQVGPGQAATLREIYVPKVLAHLAKVDVARAAYSDRRRYSELVQREEVGKAAETALHTIATYLGGERTAHQKTLDRLDQQRRKPRARTETDTLVQALSQAFRQVLDDQRRQDELIMESIAIPQPARPGESHTLLELAYLDALAQGDEAEMRAIETLPARLGLRNEALRQQGEAYRLRQHNAEAFAAYEVEAAYHRGITLIEATAHQLLRGEVPQTDPLAEMAGQPAAGEG